MVITNQNLLSLAPAAVVLTAAGLLIKFFGRAVADQRPFADDWDWIVDLSGFYFVVLFLMVPVAIGIEWALRLRDYSLVNNSFGHILRFVIVVIISYRLSIRNGAALERIYKTPSLFIRWIAEIWGRVNQSEEKYQTYLKKVLTKKYHQFWLPVMVIILSYVVTIEYLSDNLYSFLALGTAAIACLISIALDYSMASISKFPEVAVYTVGSSKPVHATLLKANGKHIRVRRGDKVIVFNRDKVTKFEIKEEGYKHEPITSIKS